MENLRWIMLGIGLAVILLIYFVGRSRSRPERHEFQEPLSADEMPSLSTNEIEGSATFDAETEFNKSLEEKPAFTKDDDFQFIPSEINHFELNDELVDKVTASVDDGLVDVITSGASVKTKHTETVEPDDTEELQIETQQQTVTEEVQTGPTDDQPDENESYDDDLIVMHVEARDAYFSGLDLLRVINHQQLKYGDMKIYHAYDEIGETIFSMSNMLKPGHFEPEHFSEMRTPGVILFMQLSLVTDPDSALDRMLFCADTLSKELDAQLTTASRKRLIDSDVEIFKKKAKYFTKTATA